MPVLHSEPWAEDSWLGSVMPCIEQVQGILSEELSDNPATLQEQLSKAEVWYSRLTKILADATARLAVAEYQSFLKAEGDSVKAKELRAKAETANDKRMVDIVRGLADSIRQRLMLGMSMAKRNSGERSDF